MGHRLSLTNAPHSIEILLMAIEVSLRRIPFAKGKHEPDLTLPIPKCLEVGGV
jgi:hypothetical protein